MVEEIKIVISTDDLVRLTMRRYPGLVLILRDDHGNYDVGGNPMAAIRLRSAIKRLDSKPRARKEVPA